MMKRYDNKGDVPSDVENDYRLRLAGEVKASTKLDKAYRDEIAELTKEIKTEPSADKKEAMRLEVERLKAEQNKEKARLVMEYKKEAANK
jgi:tellurite resistance protein